MTGSVMLAVFDSRDELMKLLREDIYATSGVWDVDNVRLLFFFTIFCTDVFFSGSQWPFCSPLLFAFTDSHFPSANGEEERKGRKERIYSPYFPLSFFSLFSVMIVGWGGGGVFGG